MLCRLPQGPEGVKPVPSQVAENLFGKVTPEAQSAQSLHDELCRATEALMLA
ncbi:MAG: hypothetical protein WCO56_09320 [Verrucomicrobiota bacterium]